MLLPHIPFRSDFFPFQKNKESAPNTTHACSLQHLGFTCTSKLIFIPSGVCMHVIESFWLPFSPFKYSKRRQEERTRGRKDWVKALLRVSLSVQAQSCGLKRNMFFKKCFWNERWNKGKKKSVWMKEQKEKEKAKALLEKHSLPSLSLSSPSYHNI